MEASDSSGVRDHVQKAIDDLRAAGEKATGDVRSGIDSAVSQLREISSDPVTKAQDHVRKELAKLAVRAQGSVESLDEIAKEVDERRQALK